MALVTKARTSSTPWSSATCVHSATNSREAVAPLVGDPAVVGDVLGEPQVDLVLARRERLGAGVRVDDEEVDRVRSDVDHPEAHAPNVVRAMGRP